VIAAKMAVHFRGRPNKTSNALPPSHLHVCTSGSCWQRGAHSTLVELEELANVVGGGVTVEKAACFGRCNRGPNVEIEWDDGSNVMLSGLKTVQDNVGAMKRATGRKVDTDPRLLSRLRALRTVSSHESCLTDVQMELEVLECSPSKLGSRSSLAKLDKLLELVDGVIAQCGEAHPLVLARTVRRKVAALRAGRPVSPSTADALDEDPEFRIACWRIESIDPCSQHSAIFRLSSQDPARGTVLSKGCEPRIWHVALHVERDGQWGRGDADGGGCGEAVDRVLREYTPISTDVAWEGGTDRSECSLLVKVYPTGCATQWLRARAVGDCVWLSPPRTTLLLPTLTPDASDAPSDLAFESVVLLAGGTGIAPLWQVMRSAMCGETRLAALPVTLVYSCRANDVLLAQPISEYIAGRTGSKAIFAVTEEASGSSAYPHVASPSLADMRGRFHAITFAEGRVSESLLREVLVEHRAPRVVVSGPEGFMDHVGTMLRQVGVSRGAIVCLKA
jgi:ferredoxin-NADP reductase